MIFDVDGVLVDVHGSFHRTIIDTVHHFTKHRPTYADIPNVEAPDGVQRRLEAEHLDWVKQLGGKAEYAKVKRQFQKFYWGVNDKRGNVMREKWLVPRRRLERWAKRAELALFTGRTRRELKFTLERFGVADLFRRVVTMDDVERLKPDPEGLHFLLDGKPPSRALYLGDNLDDALASKHARVPFLGILPRGSDARRMRGGQLRSHGAKAILDNANELDRYWK